MRLGLYYDLRNPGAARPWARVYGAALDRIAWADDEGIGAIWVTEHHGFADGYLPAFPRLRILTPAAAAAWIAGLCAGLPVTDVFCFGDIGGLPDDLVDRHTQLAVRELAPLLAEEGEL
jgi:hypothetical protein